MIFRSSLLLLVSVGLVRAAVGPDSVPLTARELAQGYADSVVLVKPRASSAASLDAVESGEGLTVLRRYRRLGGLRVLRLRSGETADQAVARLRATGRYDYVERDVLRHARVIPNDPSFSSQWSLRNTGQSGGTAGADIGATAAWDVRTDASSVIVAVIDTGARLTHTDLVDNFWNGPGGSHGINSIVGSGSSGYNSPNDDNTVGHGTHVSGTIGAVGNNGTAVTGVAWQVQLMELKFLAANGSGTLADEIECIDYAIANGANIINASYGGGPYSASELDALAAARDAGIIVVAAAGNDSADNDQVVDYPSGYALDNIVAVAASTDTDTLASYSNFGSGSVELAAPGGDGTTAGGILSLSNASDTGTRTLSGTSMAAPHVVGALALLKAEFPSDTYRQLINRLLRSVTPVPALAGEVQTGGRLDVAAALATTTSRPFNDDFADRAVIAGGTIHVRSSNAGATAEGGEPVHAGVTSSASLWWSWTAPGSADVKITTAGSAYDTVLAVYTGASLATLQSVAANDNANGTTQSQVTFTSQSGVTYQIAVAGKGGATGYTALAITAPPGNDDFTKATTLTGTSVSVAGTTLNASSQSGEPDPTGVGAGNTVWYRWTAPVSGNFVLGAFSTQIDTVAAVYTGSSLASLSVVGSNNNPAANPANTDAQVVFTAAAGTTYYFQVDNHQTTSASGAFVLTLADALWEYPASDEVTSPPAVATDGTVYFGAGSVNDLDRKVYALNPDGTKKWSYTTLSSGEGILDSAPVVGSDGTVYIGASDARFYALNPATGARKWSFVATSAIGSSAALAADGTVYFRDNTTLYALTATGSRKWSFALTGSTTGTYCSPSVGADGTIYVGTNAGAFYAVKPNGTQQWKYTADDDIFTSPAIAADGTIYFATLNGTVYALTPAGAKLWSWSTSGHTSVTSSIALGADGTLYFAGYDHKLHALSAAGSEQWSYTLGDEVRSSSPAVADDGTIYIGCYDGFVYAVNPNGTLQRTYATAQTVRSSPVIAGHQLYFGSADARLHAFAITPSLLAGDWPMFHQNQFHTGLAAAAGAAVAPAITTQPASQTATVGDDVTFTVVASGTAPLSYQWRNAGVNISGATGSSLVLPGVTTADASTYDVVVTNSAGSVTSNAATLTVSKAAATVTIDDVARTYDGTPRAVTVTTVPANLSVTVTYDATSAVPVDAGSYSVVATVQSVDYTGSASTTLVVAPAALVARADDQTKAQGAANPVLTISYEGFVGSDTAADLDTPPAIATTATTDSPAGDYPITLTGGSDNNYALTLVDGTLTVNPPPAPPVITAPPVSQSAAPGSTATFSVTVTGSTPLTYQWSKNGAVLAGATASSLTFDPVQADDAGTYTVVVTNGLGSASGGPAALTLSAPAGAPVITSQPVGATVVVGGDVTLTVAASSDTALGYQWQKDGVALAGATSASLHLAGVQPVNAGIYTVAVTNTAGTTVSAPAAVGVATTEPVAGDGSVVGANIVHPNGNLYDQVLLTGPAAAVTAVPGHVTRISFIDPADNIVQVEFAGAGTLSLALDDASGPAAPVNYNQPGVAYMKGRARLAIVGADETTNLSVFTVGRATAFDPTGHYNILLPAGPDNDPATNGSPLFSGHTDTVYGGIAEIASVAISSTDGKFGGVRTADAGYSSSSGLTGLYAPGVQFVGPVYLGNIDASGGATPMIVVGSVTDSRITGGDLFQENGAVVQVGGLTILQFASGTDSSGHLLPAQTDRGVLEENGIDVTATIIPPDPGG